MSEATFTVRPSQDEDRVPLAKLLATVADERFGVGPEPPVDIERRAAAFDLDSTIVAEGGEGLVGGIWILGPFMGTNEIAMLVAREWRGRGVGSAMLTAAIDWAGHRGLHKLSLSVFPHNEVAIALYRKFGFEMEGRRRKHVRRSNGELWDVIEMGLLLTTEEQLDRPGAASR